jgi:hypothetical protein
LGCLHVVVIGTGTNILAAAYRFLALWLSRDADLDLSFWWIRTQIHENTEVLISKMRKKITVKNIKKILTEKFNI